MSSAYSISAPDCDIHYFTCAPSSFFCAECDTYIGEEEFVPRLDLRQCGFDFCFTYDGRLLVSERAKKILGEKCATPLKFAAVDESVGFHALWVESIVTFDKDRRKTRFERKCSRCGNFESIVGATPAFIIGSSGLDDMGAYRTDLSFGSGREKSPLIVIGAGLKRELERSFPEIAFQAVNPKLK